MTLDYNERLLVAAACASSVLLAIVVMACKLSPFCLLYKYCPFKAKYDEEDGDCDVGGDSYGNRKDKYAAHYKKTPMICYDKQQLPVPDTKATFLDGHMLSEVDSVLSDASSQLSSMAKSHYNNNYLVKGSLVQKQNFLTTVTNTTNTSASSADENQNTKYLTYLGEKIQTKNANNESNGVPIDRSKQLQLAFSLQYDQPSQRLSIYISHAVDLDTNVYGSPNDSFVRLFFIKNGPKSSWRRTSSKSQDFLLEKLIRQDKNGNGGTGASLDHQEFCTKVVRRTSNPVYNEFFYVQNVKDWKRSTSVLKFVLCTTDKYSQTRVAGHCELNLHKINADLIDVQNFCLPMKEYTPVLYFNRPGETIADPKSNYNNWIITCLTSQRKKFLKYIREFPVILNENIDSTWLHRSIQNPYVRLTMVQKGRTMEKHTTTVHFNVTGVDLTFNEQFFFDLPNGEVNKVALLCSVYHKRISSSTHNSADYGTPTTALSSGSIATVADANNNLDVLSLGNLSGGSGGSSGGGGSRERASLRRSRSISSEPSLEDSSSLSVPRTRNSTRQSSNSRSICLGMIAFGSFSKSTGKVHWAEVINNPRNQITQLHKLQQ